MFSRCCGETEVLRSAQMAETHDASMRRRVNRLASFGITQKTIAKRMGISESTLSKWINGTTPPLSVDALQGLDDFENEIRSGLGGEKETERASGLPDAAAGGDFRRK